MTAQSRPENASTQPLRFGQYVLLDRINVGGMAEVFKAKAFGVEGFEKIVAIKRILPTMSEDDEFIKMFVDEARITVQLHHENIVQVHELGRESGQYYIAMEYVSGRDMRQVLDAMKKRGLTIPVSTAAYIASSVAEGLDYAHHKADANGNNLNLIHRDVSPQNILVSYDGAVKITDFGIAKAEDRASKTQAGVLKGKFAYMSPEQVRGQTIDGRSDIFAVGILLYEMVTGERLFLGESDFSTLDKVRKAEVRPPSELNADLPPALEAIILKALAREPGDRYLRGAELAEALEQFLIEDTTIFSAKRMRSFMEQHFSEDRERELSRMRSLPPTPPPPPAGATSGGPPPPPMPDDVPALGGESEKTVIFAGGMDFGGEKTELFDASKLGLFDLPSAGSEPPSDRSNDATVMFEPKELEKVVAETGVTKASPVAAPTSGLTRGLQAIAGLVTLALVALGVVSLVGGDSVALRVNVDPNVPFELRLDGKVVGTESPVVVPSVSIGEHRLSVSAEGYLSQEYTFEVVEGSENQVNLALEADESAFKNGQMVIVTDPPNAEVIINGGQPLQSPVTQENLDRRIEHVIQVSAQGFLPQTRRFVFREGQKETLQIKLEKVLLKASLKVTSRPSDAIVMLDGKPIGKTPLDLSDVAQSEGARLSVLLAGFEPYNEVLVLKPGKLSKVDARLKAIPTQKAKGKGCTGEAGKWSVMTVNIPDCRVRIGRTEMGVAPFFKKKGPSGRCEIKVECLDGRKKVMRRKAQAGVNERIIIKPGDWK